MKVDDNINNRIAEFKRNLEDNTEFKKIQNKMRIVQIVKNIYYLSLIIFFKYLYKNQSSSLFVIAYGLVRYV